MLEQIFKTVTGASFIIEQGRRNADELKELRAKHYELSLVVQRLATEVDRIREREAHEREKLLLRIENLLATGNVKPQPARKKFPKKSG